jgi:hypothetical protein
MSKQYFHKTWVKCLGLPGEYCSRMITSKGPNGAKRCQYCTEKLRTRKLKDPLSYKD